MIAMPAAWLHTRAVGIDKLDGGVRQRRRPDAPHRPHRHARDVVAAECVPWCPGQPVGGVPNKNATLILNDLGDDVRKTAAGDDDILGIKLDLAVRFDRVRFEGTQDFLKCLGAPSRLITALAATDNGRKRWIAYARALRPEPIVATRVIFQGCPASPLRLVAVMAA